MINIIRVGIDFSLSCAINGWEYIFEGEAMFLDEIFFQVFDRTIELDLFF